MLKAHEARDMAISALYMESVEKAIRDSAERGRRHLRYVIEYGFPEDEIVTALQQAGYQARAHGERFLPTWRVSERKRYIDISW